MADRTEIDQDDKGLSARHLILAFLIFVAVCGVFFSLGFLVGYNERASRTNPVTEHISSPPLAPPVVNPPPEPSQTATPANTAAEPAAKPPAEPLEPKSSTIEPSSPPPATSAPVAKAESQAEPAPPAAAPTHSGDVGVGFTVQVAALRAKEDAEAVVKILKGRDYPVFLVSPEYAHANDNLFRVQVGPFRTHDEAEKVRKQLSAEGFNPFIRH